MRDRFFVLLFIASAVSAGCAADPIPPPSSASDPSNPDAPEAPMPSGAPLLGGSGPASGAQADTAPATDHHHHPAPATDGGPQ